MKLPKKIILIPLLAVIFNFSVTGQTNYVQKAEDSFKLWKKMKTEHKGYTYTTNFVSDEGGFGWETKIEVQNGIVVSRSFRNTELDYATGVDKAIGKWKVQTANFNNIDDYGTKAITIDEIYKQAISIYLAVPEATNQIFFNTKHDGVVSICGYFPKDCHDDCFEGYTITEFKWLD